MIDININDRRNVRLLVDTVLGPENSLPYIVGTIVGDIYRYATTGDADHLVAARNDAWDLLVAVGNDDAWSSDEAEDWGRKLDLAANTEQLKGMLILAILQLLETDASDNSSAVYNLILRLQECK